VLQLVRAFEKASGRPIPYRIVDRRPGDLPAFWADATLARERLGWQATRGLDAMCADSWRWQSANPNGFA
jgi:UDP-glucose 4-epimerase